MTNYANPFTKQAVGPNVDPNTGLGGPNSDIFYYNQVPEAGYWAWLFGINPAYWGTDPRSRFAQGNYGRMLNQFNAEAAADPTLEWYPWLHRQKDPGQEFAQQNPDARGEGGFRLVTPRARWNITG
jgi:hypothetical protein